MNSDEEILHPARRTHRLTLDSEEEERKQQQRRRQEQQYERQRQERRKRKQEKKRLREERERQAEMKAKRQAEERMKEVEKYNDPAKLFQMDSDSSVNFKRVARKIKIMYPQFNKKSRKYDSDDSDSDDSDEEESSEQQSQSSQHKPKKTKKISKKRHDDESPAHPKKPKNKGAVKVEHEMTRKENLVHQIARRWWYAIPDWPPTDFQYEKQLKKHGYRIVKSSEFRLVDDVKDGLVKVTQLEGYKGIYRSKYKLIDIRPKQTTPSINYFYSLSESQLARLVKKALQEQIRQLKEVEFVQSGQKELLIDLQKQLANFK